NLFTCQKISTQEECEALANGSLWDVGYKRCVGVNKLPSFENCAAYGDNYYTTTGRCMPIKTEAECSALASEAIFDVGYERCLGRCDYRESILDTCYKKK